MFLRQQRQQARFSRFQPVTRLQPVTPIQPQPQTNQSVPATPQNHSMQNVSVSIPTHTPARVRPLSDTPAQRSIGFDYEFARQNPRTDSIVAKVSVPPDQLAGLRKPWIVISYINTNNDSDVQQRRVPLQFDRQGNVYFELDGLNPETVYKMKVAIADTNPAGTEITPKINLGAYWGMTSGNTKLARARFNFVSTLLTEANGWRTGGRNLGNVPYANTPGGWCGEFPHWAAKRFLRLSSENPSNDYKRYGQFLNGNQLANVASQSPIAGTFAWWRNNGNSHKMTVLGYSKTSNVVYTLEGNLNGRVAITTRRPSELGYIGVMAPQMAWDNDVAQAR